MRNSLYYSPSRRFSRRKETEELLKSLKTLRESLNPQECNIYTPPVPLTFNNGKCLLYRSEKDIKKEFIKLFGGTSMLSLFMYMAYRSWIGPSGFIFKTLKLGFSGIGLISFAPVVFLQFSKISSLVREVYLEENGEVVVFKTLLKTRRYALVQLRSLDEEDFVHAMEWMGQSATELAPVLANRSIYYIHRRGTFYHADVFKAIFSREGARAGNRPGAVPADKLDQSDDKGPDGIMRINTVKNVIDIEAEEVKMT